jgi:hypothetical protein
MVTYSRTGARRAEHDADLSVLEIIRVIRLIREKMRERRGWL